MAALDGVDKLAVVSPHTDDAVLSVGATVASYARRGVAVRVVTVFAGEPASPLPASYWDVQRGAATQAEAARQRRAEDEAACRELGVAPVWLPFADSGYVALRNPDEIWAALQPQVGWADLTLLPGWPLSHADHRYVTLLVIQRSKREIPLGFYAELPYASEPMRIVQARLRGRTVAPLRHALDGPVHWQRQSAAGEDRAKRKAAIARYGGELDNLGLRGRWKLASSRFSGEWLGFPRTTLSGDQSDG